MFSENVTLNFRKGAVRSMWTLLVLSWFCEFQFPRWVDFFFFRNQILSIYSIYLLNPLGHCRCKDNRNSGVDLSGYKVRCVEEPGTVCLG